MPIKPFREIPRDAVEWARYLQQTEVTPDPGSVGAEQLQDGSVTFLKLQNVQPDRLLGRDSSPAGAVQELEVTGGLEFTGSGIRRSALTGDVTAAAGDAGTTIANNAVTYAKMQNVSATDRLLGRATAGAGDVEEITCTAAGRALLDDATAADQRTTLGLPDSTYTPTLTSVTNVDASGTYVCHYFRLGNVVSVGGTLDINCTATAATELGISLPIPSAFASAVDCAGTAFASAVAGMGGAIFADVANARATLAFVSTDTNVQTMRFCFMYRVI